MNAQRFIFTAILILCGTFSFAEVTTVDVTITLIDAKRSSITVSYDGKSKQLELAKNVSVEVDGKRTESRALIPGDNAVVTYDKDRQVVTKIAVRRPAMVPAEKLADGWEDMDQRLVFLVSRLADVEASLDAIEQIAASKDRQMNSKTRDSKRADRDNEDMDRKGGGPIKWSEFYGTTAEKFFYHPTDRNSSYHTVTVLSQQGSQADNKVGGGVPSSQGLPVHQRPPQFDYIYRANEKAKARAISEASELRGKIDQLNARRQKLEAEQAVLWVDIAFRSVGHYDLDKKPVYRYEPLLMASDTDSRNKAAMMKATSSFMAQLRVTTFSTFVSENSALGAKLIVAARSQGDVRLKRWFDDSITTLSMLGFCSIMLRTWLFCGLCADIEAVVLQIESVYGSVASLLSCFGGLVFDLNEYIHLRALGTSYGVFHRSIF